MATQSKKGLGTYALWLIIGLLILSLGGFGIGSFGGTVRVVATVGTQEITIEDYARAIQQESRALSQQTGQALSMQQMQAFGLDRLVLQRLVAEAALNHEASEMGLSVGDAEVARQIRETPNFAGPSGDFDRESYSFLLRSLGYSEREFESEMRKDASRGLLQGAILGGLQTPDIYASTLAAHMFETRDIRLAFITQDSFSGGALSASEAELRGFYNQDPDRFAKEEQRRVNVAWVSPETLSAQLNVDDTILREIYEARLEEFQEPDRLMLDKLVYSDENQAIGAMGELLSGVASFEDLLETRGLTPSDADLGVVTRSELEEETFDALFKPEDPAAEFVGPLPDAFGFAIYRVNARLDATKVEFEVVAPDLAAEYAADQARRQIEDAMPDIDDLLAAGASLTEIADESLLELETFIYDPEATEGLSGYATFRAAAQAISASDFPELLTLSDGGIFAMELVDIIPAHVPDFEAVRADVERAWELDILTSRLENAASYAAEQIKSGARFEEVGLTGENITGLRRNGFLAGLTPQVYSQIFSLTEQETVSGTVALDNGLIQGYVMHLEAITPANLEDADIVQALDLLKGQITQSFAQDVFEAFGQAIQNEVGLTVNQAALTAANASFSQ